MDRMKHVRLRGNRTNAQLFEQAIAGDIRAIILWEWMHHAPHITGKEIDELFEIIARENAGVQSVANPDIVATICCGGDTQLPVVTFGLPPSSTS